MFEVWLPTDRPVPNQGVGDAAAVAEEASEVDLDHPLAGITILIVDDDQDALAVLRIVLVDRGAAVISASSVEEALSLLAIEVPDLLISDIGMSGRDGYDLLKQVRAEEADRASDPHRRGRLPAIALTSFARDEDLKQAELAGFDAHCAKPLKPLTLVRRIDSLLGRASVANGPTG